MEFWNFYSQCQFVDVRVRTKEAAEKRLDTRPQVANNLCPPIVLSNGRTTDRYRTIESPIRD